MSLTMENIDILKAEIKSILAVKAKEGATFRDIKGNFKGQNKNLVKQISSNF